MDYTNSSLLIDTAVLAPGAIRWRSPSNIAIVKYWGKHGVQLPQNPSLSFTLSSAATDLILVPAALFGFHMELRHLCLGLWCAGSGARSIVFDEFVLKRLVTVSYEAGKALIVFDDL